MRKIFILAYSEVEIDMLENIQAMNDWLALF